MRHFVLAMALCGCGASSAKHEIQSPNDEQARASARDAGVESAASSPPPLGEAECQELFEHVFQIAFESQRSDLPEEQRPTEADLARAKEELRPKLFGQCLGASRAEFHYDCAMSADDMAAMEACVGAEGSR